MEKTQIDDREHHIVFKPLVASRTAAAVLGMHNKTLERMAKKELVPATKIAGHLRYRLSILSGWINEELKSNSKTDSKAEEKKEEPP